jgi:hypothetical protein
MVVSIANRLTAFTRERRKQACQRLGRGDEKAEVDARIEFAVRQTRVRRLDDRVEEDLAVSGLMELRVADGDPDGDARDHRPDRRRERRGSTALGALGDDRFRQPLVEGSEERGGPRTRRQHDRVRLQRPALHTYAPRRPGLELEDRVADEQLRPALSGGRHEGTAGEECVELGVSGAPACDPDDALVEKRDNSARLGRADHLHLEVRRPFRFDVPCKLGFRFGSVPLAALDDSKLPADVQLDVDPDLVLQVVGLLSPEGARLDGERELVDRPHEVSDDRGEACS